MAIPVALGTVNFGTSIDPASAFAVLDMFQTLGGRQIDTANNYAFWHAKGHGGESEATIGAWLQKQDRGAWEIMTKIGAVPLDGKSFGRVDGLSAQNIQTSINACLSRLQTNYVDVLFAHLDDPHTPLEESWSALSALVAKGLVRKLGISNYSHHRVVALAALIERDGLAPISFAQYRGTVIAPVTSADFAPQIALDDALLTLLRHLSPAVTVMAYSPLLDGCFEQAPVQLPASYDSQDNRRLVVDLQQQAQSQQVGVSALVLKILHQRGIVPVTATSNALRLKANLQLFL